jgi:hypothetical protein
LPALHPCSPLIHTGYLHVFCGHFLHLGLPVLFTCALSSFIGGREVRRQQMTKGVHSDMNLASPLFLVPVIAGAAAALHAALQGARIEDYGCGLGFMAVDQAQQHPQIVHDGFKAPALLSSAASVAAPYTRAADHWGSMRHGTPERTK